MNWDATDFLVFGALLIGAGTVLTLVYRRFTGGTYRAAAGVAIVTAFLLIWINGAVGIIGDSGHAANAMYAGVIAIGVIGAVAARFQPRGMMWALVATAAVQAVVGTIALVGGIGASGPSWPCDVLVLTFFFTALWLLSAWLFKSAART